MNVIILFATYLVLVGCCFYLLMHIDNLGQKTRIQASLIKVLKESLELQPHTEEWNHVQDLIIEQFGGSFVSTGWNDYYSPKRRLCRLLREQHGKMNLEQIHFIITLVHQIRELANESMDEVATSPIDQDIEFDSEGGFRVVKKTKT